MPLKVWMSWCTSSSDLPLTAEDISEADDWLMEQPGAADLQVGQLAVLDQEADDDLIAAERVEALHPVGRGGFELAPVTRRAVVVEDDLPVEIVEVAHQPAPGAKEVTRTIYRLPPIPQSALRCRARR